MKKLFCALLMVFTHGSNAQHYVETSLRQGPFKVGFMGGVHYDLSRPPLPEQYARFQQGRAVHISVWYPARTKNNHPNMLFGEYVDEMSKMVNPNDVTRQTRAESLQTLNAMLSRSGGDSIRLPQHISGLMNSTMKAYRNATLQAGDFPVLIYPHGPVLNTILCEYLASHGYIVVSLPEHGTFSSAFEERKANEMETLVQDCQFALAVIRREFSPRQQQFAVMGAGANVTTGIAWMMRNPQVAASISVVHEKSNGHLDLVQRSPYFDITRAASPMLVVSHDEIATPKFVFDYRYADRYLVTLAAGPGIDCANVVAWGANIPGLLNSAPGRARLEFEWTARYVLYFLDWKMKGGTHGRQFFARSPQENGIPERLLNYHTMAGTDIPPTPDALMAIRNRSGFEHMIQTVSNCLLQDTVAFSLSTYVTLGQRLFKDDGFEDGVRLASFIQGQFPHAAAGYALAGDCLLAQGKTTTAHLMYGKALEKLPNDTFLSFTDKSDLRKRIALRSKQVTE